MISSGMGFPGVNAANGVTICRIRSNEIGFWADANCANWASFVLMATAGSIGVSGGVTTTGEWPNLLRRTPSLGGPVGSPFGGAGLKTLVGLDAPEEVPEEGSDGGGVNTLGVGSS